MNTDVFESVCAMGDAARTVQSQLAQANTEAKNQLLNAIHSTQINLVDAISMGNIFYQRIPVPLLCIQNGIRE